MLSQGGRRRARAAGVRGMGRARAAPPREQLLCGLFGAAAGAGCGERPPGEARRVDARGLRREGRHRASARAETREITCDLVRFKVENKPHE